MRLALVCVTALTVSCACAQDLQQRLGDVLVELAEPAEIPGVSAAAVLADGTVIAVARGLARREPAAPMTTRSRLFSGSIGKTYCAVVLLQLVADGLVDLDAPVAEYLGDLDWYHRLPNADEMTVRQLANHTAGMRDHVWFPDFHEALAQDPMRHWNPEEIMAYLLDDKPLFNAGAGWSYADTNYILLGMVLEEAAERPFYDELQRRVLDPLHLKDTIPSDSPDLPGLISGYSTLGLVPGLPEVSADGRYQMNPQFEWTGGGLIFTTSDLARFMHALFTTDLVRPDLRQEMLDAVPSPRLGPGTKYGLGVVCWPTPHGESIGHSGIFPGFLSRAAHFTDHGFTVAIQFNTDHQEAARRLGSALNTLAGVLIENQQPR